MAKVAEYKGQTIKMLRGKWRLDYHGQDVKFDTLPKAKAFIDRMEPKTFVAGAVYKIQGPSVVTKAKFWEGTFVNRRYIPAQDTWLYTFEAQDGQHYFLTDTKKVTKKRMAKV